MKSSRDCVENYWLTHITNFKRQNISIRRYCIENELKCTTFHDWIRKFKVKYPEGFDSLHIIKDRKLGSDPPEENLFIEIKNTSNLDQFSNAKDLHPPTYTNYHTVEKEHTHLLISYEGVEVSFSTFPQAEWLIKVLKGISHASY